MFSHKSCPPIEAEAAIKDITINKNITKSSDIKSNAKNNKRTNYFGFYWFRKQERREVLFNFFPLEY